MTTEKISEREHGKGHVTATMSVTVKVMLVFLSKLKSENSLF